MKKCPSLNIIWLSLALVFHVPSLQASALSSCSKIALSMLFLLHGSEANGYHTVAQGTGLSPKMVWDSQERPVMVVHNNQTKCLEFLRCGNKACDTGNIWKILTCEGDVGWNPDLVLDSSDTPYIVCRNATKDDLLFIQCSDSICTEINSQVVLDEDHVGWYASIKLGVDGYPGISYYDEFGKRLKFAKCNNVACTGSVTISILDDIGDPGKYSSQVLNQQGYPLFTYYGTSLKALKFLRCAMVSCAYNSISFLLDYEGDVGAMSFMRLRQNFAPSIFYYDNTNGTLRLHYCTNGGCTVTNHIYTIYDGGIPGTNLVYTVQLNGDDLPVIVYIDPQTPTYDLMVMTCDRSDCTRNNTFVKVGSMGEGGENSALSLLLDTRGNAVIGYYNSSSNSLNAMRVTLHFTDAPTSNPTVLPTFMPTSVPSSPPTNNPTHSPSRSPSSTFPTGSPSASPSYYPSYSPSHSPTNNPTLIPSTNPSFAPTPSPTNNPSASPTIETTQEYTTDSIDEQGMQVSGDNSAAIVTLVSGCVLLFCITTGIVIFCFFKRKEKEKKHNERQVHHHVQSSGQQNEIEMQRHEKTNTLPNNTITQIHNTSSNHKLHHISEVKNEIEDKEGRGNRGGSVAKTLTEREGVIGEPLSHTFDSMKQNIIGVNNDEDIAEFMGKIEEDDDPSINLEQEENTMPEQPSILNVHSDGAMNVINLIKEVGDFLDENIENGLDDPFDFVASKDASILMD